MSVRPSIPGIRCILLLLPVLLGACGVQSTFTGEDTAQLWRAMQAAAEAPDYDKGDITKRWTVVENIVEVDNVVWRIDITRHLKRLLRRPGAKPLYEDLHWRFEIQLLHEDPPRVQFSSIDLALPTKVQYEGDRYLAEVRSILSGYPRPAHLKEVQDPPTD